MPVAETGDNLWRFGKIKIMNAIKTSTTILLVAALPTAAISLRSANGWRAGVVFAAFYPAPVVLVGIVMIASFLSLAALGVVDLD